MIGLIGTAIGIGIMARVATSVCNNMSRPYQRYPRNNNYRKNPYQRPQRQQTHQQQLPLQRQQTHQQQRPKPRPRYSYKPRPLYNKNRKQPYWKMKTI